MIRRRLHSPIAIGAAVAAIAMVFVVLRLLVAADRDVSRFVVAGNLYTDAAIVEPTIHTLDGAGYDGQFYWRLATDPSALHVDAHRGVRFDAEFRATRIAYPTIAWALSLGQPALVKWSLVVTNVLGMGVIAISGASLARTHGRHALVGAAIASSSGLVMAISRDLTEVTMVAALTAGVACVARRQYALASVSWTLAVLIHEQALFCIVPFAAYHVVGKIRRREWSLSAGDAAWIAPLAGFAAWQLICRAVLDEFPLTTSKGNLDIPFRGLIDKATFWIEHGIGPVEAIVLPQLALLATLVVIAFRSCKTLASEDGWLRWALLGATALSLSLSDLVWAGPAELRQVVVLSTIAWLVIVVSGRQIPIALVAATGAVWLATAAVRVVEI